MTEPKEVDGGTVSAIVKGPNAFFYDKVLYQPGQRVLVDLGKLGIKSLGESKTLVPADGAPDLTQVPIAAVAPHAPNPAQPQGIPPGAKIGAGGMLVKGGAEFVPETRDTVEGQAKRGGKPS